MELNLIVEQLKAQAANVSPFGAKLKFLIDGQAILIDGHDQNKISLEDADADCTIITDAETLLKLKSGDLNPMVAVFTGKVKIKGDQSLALKLQNLL